MTNTKPDFMPRWATNPDELLTAKESGEEQ